MLKSNWNCSNVVFLSHTSENEGAAHPEAAYHRPDSRRDVLMARKRGNPNWGSGRLPRIPALPTAFEKQVQRLGLNEQTCATSEELERWCELNKNHCYIPESLLKQWGMFVDADVRG
jgi:hypothetical protein